VGTEFFFFLLVFHENKFQMLKLHIVKTELQVGNKHCEVLEHWPLS